ncbi:hypothetical protein FAZ78_03030 [Cereibacter changlensis]|uniref:histidine kinase n=1 Tax=Cereibacter changlensis TaxID=402884 RepID=A0A4U0Z479_9RHOB|nr:hypothetical protein [Cereibacter changlensis]TKA98046.1 hypothetical protein FAZ78_03030 [Cereibacter changlensis]
MTVDVDGTRPEIPRRTLSVAMRGWRSLGLTAQFMLLVFLILVPAFIISERMERFIAKRQLLESSLAVEEVVLRSEVLPIMGSLPLRGALPEATAIALDNAIHIWMRNRHIVKLKIWSVEGRLLFDSLHASPLGAPFDEAAVARALAGETVTVELDPDSAENLNDVDLGAAIREVYMPLRALDGTMLGVVEVYYDFDQLVARLDALMNTLDLVRIAVLSAGMLLLAILVRFAHRRLILQDGQLRASLQESERLFAEKARLLAESEELRRGASEASETLLNQIGTELHDGPVQLLSLAALYRGKIQVADEDEARVRKAQDLLDQSLRDLRNISAGLILPELEGASLEEAVERAVSSFTRDSGLPVELQLPPGRTLLPAPQVIVAYRVVCEALTNARKHAGGRGLRVTKAESEREIGISIVDAGPCPAGAAASGAFGHAPLGLIGMQNRARSSGGQLSMERVLGGGTRVSLVLPKDDS